MDRQDALMCTAFEGYGCIASGDLLHVARKVKKVIDRGVPTSILIFDDLTGEPIEVDFRGTVEEVVKRLDTPSAVGTAPAAVSQEPGTIAGGPRGPGRPRLGVVAREVTLLPRHWEWLSSQPGGASVALRKLVEEARRVNINGDKIRRCQEAAYRFMSAVAGNLPGYEEATRALFAGNEARFNECVDPWPVDVRDYARRISAVALQTPEC